MVAALSSFCLVAVNAVLPDQYKRDVLLGPFGMNAIFERDAQDSFRFTKLRLGNVTLLSIMEYETRMAIAHQCPPVTLRKSKSQVQDSLVTQSGN